MKPAEPSANVFPETTPEILFVSAKGHLMATRLLLESPNHPAFDHTIYMLFGYVIELSLKAIVLSAGATTVDLKQVGHDLKKLWTAAQASGFTCSSTDLPRVIEEMAVPHRQHLLRYVPDVLMIELPPADRSYFALAALVDDTDAYLEARGLLAPLESLRPAK